MAAIFSKQYIIFTFAHAKAYVAKFDICIGQGQPRVITWIILVVLVYTMPHTKIQGHRFIGSGKADFLRFSPYMGMEATLVMWLYSFLNIFIPIHP